MYLNTVLKYNVFKYCPALPVEPKEDVNLPQINKIFYL